MSESVILFVVFIFVIALLALPFIWSHLNKSNILNKTDLSKFAIYLSVIVLFGFVFAYILKVVSGSDIDWPRFILLSISPIATISGFYMVYQTFNVQTNNSKKQEIHELIKLQNRILGEIELVEKDLNSSKPSEPKKYLGRAAFKKIIEDFNTTYESYKIFFDALILKSIDKHCKADLSLGLQAQEYLTTISSESDDKKDEVQAFIENNYDIFRNNVVLDTFFKSLTYKELLTSLVYLRMYFNGNSGERFLENKFNFDSLYLRSYFDDLIQNLNKIQFKFPENESDDYLALTSLFSGSTNTIYYDAYKIEKTLDFSDLYKFYPKDIITKTKENSQDLQLYLDTYFRNLFNAYKTVAKIENQTIRTDSARLLRTQISNYEQAVIFLNSLTPMGKDWQKDGKLNLFKDFNVIKNISENIIEHIQPWEIYPEKDGFEYEFLNNKKNS